MKVIMMSNKIRQHFAAVLLALVALLLAGCGGAQTSTNAPVSDAVTATAAASAPAASAVPTAQTTTEAVPTEAATVATTEATAGATTEATAGATTEATAEASTAQDATPAIVAATNAFLATLSDSERESVLFDFSDTEQKQRWSNLPEGLFERAGLRWGDLSEEQHTAWLAVMQATLSTDGYNQIVAEWNADDALTSGGASGPGGAPLAGGLSGAPPMGGPGEQAGTLPAAAPIGQGGPGGGQLLYGTEYYWIAIIGTPSETDPWQWQWGGHHVTVNATIAGANIALTPSFIGVQPGEYTDASGNTIRPLSAIEEDAFALVNALDATQQQRAVLGEASIDLVLGPGQEGVTIQSEGLPASEMTNEQQTGLLELIEHYTGLANDEDAAVRLAEIQSTLDETYFAWYGPTAEGSAAYFRVTGPTIVIEFSSQGGGGTGTGLGGEATLSHIHGVYRDPTNDYGAKYTGIEIGS